MQAQGHVQMVTRLIDYGQNPQVASDTPRWQVLDDFSVLLEPGFAPEVASSLKERGHKVSYATDSWSFGGAQLIIKTEHGYVGGSDHRKEGCVAGF
jgi:gamma-glutamyltranspeptidase/glutathione hydrolase